MRTEPDELQINAFYDQLPITEAYASIGTAGNPDPEIRIDFTGNR